MRAAKQINQTRTEPLAFGYSDEYHHSRNLKKKIESGRRYFRESMTVARVSTPAFATCPRRPAPKNLSPSRALASLNSLSNNF